MSFRLTNRREVTPVPTLSHSYFGKFEFLAAGDIDAEIGDVCELRPIPFQCRKLTAFLHYSVATLDGFTVERLDPLAALAQRLAELDPIARQAISAAGKHSNWLADRFNAETWLNAAAHAEGLRKLAEIFPGAQKPDDVSAEQIMAALRLDHVSFSLVPDPSYGPPLTLDYRILQRSMDDLVFAAKFDIDGKLIDTMMES